VTSIPVDEHDRSADATRFPFGRNWKSFVGVLTEERIAEAVAALEDMLGAGRIAGASFLDVGSGSGLSSLAASRLGAARIHSFDFDADSVASTEAVRNRYGSRRGVWTIERGSVLDAEYLSSLGVWDIVYSWGVLHHTGAMWQAFERVTGLVRPGGMLFISIYNDQGSVSRGWKLVKRLYNTGSVGKLFVMSVFVPYFVGRGVLADLVRLRNPLARYREYHRTRGMSMVHDWLDWLGGYPFEVARPEQISEFFQARGFALRKLKTCGERLGCNEFVFLRTKDERAGPGREHAPRGVPT
jgi:2-polyprenyl-3-methyl-5-hydroxy-6-metoxy-1,4-benzoquinol methylase